MFTINSFTNTNDIIIINEFKYLICLDIVYKTEIFLKCSNLF